MRTVMITGRGSVGSRWTRAALVASVTATVLLATPGRPYAATVHPAGLPPSEYHMQLVNGESGLCLTIAGGSRSAGQYAVQYDCDTDPSRLWKTQWIDPDTNEQGLWNENSELCLAPAGDASGAGVALMSLVCRIGPIDPDETWTEIGEAAGRIELQNAGTLLCATTTGMSENAGIVQAPCDANNPADLWTRSFGDAVRNIHSARCRRSSALIQGANVPIVQTTCDPLHAGQWRMLYSSTGYAIQSAGSPSWCLSPAGGVTTSNAEIVEYYCDGDPSRMWWPIQLADGTYELQNIHSFRCLSPAAGGVGNKTVIVQLQCDRTTPREWALDWLPS